MSSKSLYKRTYTKIVIDYDVGIVVDYAYTMSAKLLTLHTQCYLTISIVNYYTDTEMTKKTLLENLEGFSQILKKQSGKTKMCLHI